MARKDWKTPHSFTLSKDVAKCVRELSAKFGITRSSVAEMAILYLHEKHFPKSEKVA